VKLGLEECSRLRVETTVVETDIHHPTDNTLLWDVVRILTRLLGRLAKALELRRIALRNAAATDEVVAAALGASGTLWLDNVGKLVCDALNGICRYYPFLGGGGNR
jgi:hypothetical protein